MSHAPTMLALVLHAIGDARCEDAPRPQAGAGQVLVRVAYCGVCGSDIPRFFDTGTYSFPRICGHEFSGVVEALGAGVEGVAVGDAATVFPLIWCGRCPLCQAEQHAQCEVYDYLGSRSDGAFAEYVVAPARNVRRLPDGVSLLSGSMTEPAAVAFHALQRAGGCIDGESITIFGAGPIGLLVAQWARSMGAAPVILFDVIQEKLALAQRLGFENACNSAECDPVDYVELLTQGQGTHVSVDAAGVAAATIQALTVARRGGRVVLLGNPSAEVKLPSQLISRAMRRELDIFGTWNSRFCVGGDDDWDVALSAMADSVLNVEPLVTHCIPLDQAFEAMRMMQERREFFCKTIIKLS